MEGRTHNCPALLEKGEKGFASTDSKHSYKKNASYSDREDRKSSVKYP